jgi:valyl-tRNA synthetase
LGRDAGIVSAMSDEFPPRYDAAEVEARLYPQWEARGDFTADASAVLERGATPFTVMIPPPNVTGALHMGHALNNTLQDVLCRWRRMVGDEVLWLPGTDHAGIATQAVVEKRLFQDKGIRRVDMGREAFVAEVWKWNTEYGGTILRQLRRMGCGCDWSRTKFTMDDDLSHAVRKAFVDLFNEGLVYRGARIVNWDCALETAVSDDEIDHEDRKGRLWHLRYPLSDGEGWIEVATTRPETMFGDTGVAVNPEDPRYTALVGRTVRLPLVGRDIPVVADASVDPTFGTGAVKVTPGHDPEDYERGRRHRLPVLVILDSRGRVTGVGAPWDGLSREQARDRVVQEFEALGLLGEVKDHALRVAISDRSKTVIEPIVSEQWFVRMEPLAAPAIAAVKDGTLHFRPERWTKVYLDWLENVRDWCISRQLWWGHRIPVWYDEDGNTEAFLEDPEPGRVHATSGKPFVRRDEDVLDTWASSWLWPLSTLGWPDREADDFRAFYPTRFLSTAREIIYLWVARMVMAGYRFDGRCPFDTVYIHATILDGKGRRMSKSAGNGIDPVDMVDRFGADAVRFTLTDLTTEGQDVRLAETRFETGRNFMNKIWNAGRFAATYPDPGVVAQPARAEDRWILDRAGDAAAAVDRGLTEYRFHDTARTLYGFIWNDLCDWYLEMAKGRLADPADGDARAVLHEVMRTVLGLMQPFCPFLTEELWRRLGYPLGDAVTLARTPWPRPPRDRWPDAVHEVELLKSVVTAVRNLRSETRVSEGAEVSIHVRAPAVMCQTLLRQEPALRRLARASELQIAPDAVRPKLSAVAHLDGEIEVSVGLEGHIDVEAEKIRLAKERDKARAAVTAADAKLGNADFLSRAKPEVVDRERERRDENAALADRLQHSLDALC